MDTSGSFHIEKGTLEGMGQNSMLRVKASGEFWVLKPKGSLEFELLHRSNCQHFLNTLSWGDLVIHTLPEPNE